MHGLLGLTLSAFAGIFFVGGITVLCGGKER